MTIVGVMSGLALSTDFYQLTMMAGYYAAGLMAPATFELYMRELPVNRSFLVAAGTGAGAGVPGAPSLSGRRISSSSAVFRTFKVCGGVLRGVSPAFSVHRGGLGCSKKARRYFRRSRCCG